MAGRTNVHGVTGSRKPAFYTVQSDYMILPICTVLRGYRKLDYYTVCCWQQLLLIRTRYADSVVTPYRSPGCADVLCGARADVTHFSYMTLMDKPAVKHNMLKRKLD